MRIGFHLWSSEDGIARAQMAALRRLGQDVCPIGLEELGTRDLDLLLTNGPFGSLLPLGDRLAALPASRRPRFALLLSEQLWNPRIPRRVGRGLGRARMDFERLAHRRSAEGRLVLRPRLASLAGRGLRFRYAGEIDWLAAEGLLARLFLPSAWLQGFLAGEALPTSLVHNGCDPGWAEDLGLERDLPVLWLGKPGSRRRRRWLDRIEAELAARGVPLHRVDGERQPYVFGRERARLLNRSRIVLNLLRAPWDSNYLRHLLAMPNGAMVLSEPTLPHAPFEPGRHLAVAAPEDIAEQATHYLEREEERAAIAARGKAFVQAEMTMDRSMASVLEALRAAPERSA